MSEFTIYKANRTKEITDRYTGILTNIINGYNKQIANVLKTRTIPNKSARVASLKQLYETDRKRIIQQMNAEIATIVMPISLVAENANKKALLVGINYIGTSYELSGCISDVENMAAKLVGFSSIESITDNTAMRPTKANILQQFTKLLQNAMSGDLLIFSFSGHGTQIADRNGDEMDGKDEGFLTIDNYLIVDDEVNRIIKQNIKPGVTLFMLFDCCHSGTIADLRYNYLNYLENMKNTETTGDVIMISGCRDEQTSAEAYADGKIQGATTCVFLHHLQPEITWRQLLLNMQNALATSGYIQVPKLSSGKFINLDSKCLLA